MYNFKKHLNDLSNNTKQLTFVCLISMLIFIIIQSVMLHNLKKDLNSQYTEFSKVVQQTIIEKEPDYLQSDLPHTKLGKFSLSWYSPKELGKQFPHELRTSRGLVPKEGRTIAVDPKVIPYGSIVYIQDYGYFIAEDCGGHIKGNRIDIFTASYQNAIQNGRRVANVYLLGKI